MLLLLSLFPFGGTAAPSARTGNAGLSAQAAPNACNAAGSLTPSAILSLNANPAHNLSAGGTLSVVYEIAVVNFTNASPAATIHVPNLWFKFPLLGGTTYQIHENATVFTITAPGWTDPNLTRKSVVVPGGLAFNASQKATLTSQKLAVMADATYGNLTIEIRWQWQNTVGAGRPTGAWSTLTWSSNYPKSLATIFEPAPYAVITNFNATAVIGSNYSLNLSGLVASQRFFLEMEYPGSGKVVQDLPTTAGPNATNVTVSIPVLNYVHALSPGTYLVHIHDSCGAMLWNKSVKAVYPPNATLTFLFVPGTCGPITFNGSTFKNGSSVVVLPSTVAYNFSLAVCKGHPFNNWSTSGGLHIASSKTLLVSASGTFTVYYH